MSNDEIYGGSSEQDEKCPDCDKIHRVYRSGSWDWEPRTCNECVTQEIRALLYRLEKKNGT